MGWLAQLSALNPIEHLWEKLLRGVWEVAHYPITQYDKYFMKLGKISTDLQRSNEPDNENAQGL